MKKFKNFLNLIIISTFFFSSLFVFGTSKVYTQSPPGSNQLTPEMDKFLQELEKLNREKRMLNVPRKDGIVLRMLVEMIKAKNAVEIGTSNGYSAIWLGLGLKSTGGKLTSLEISPEKVKMARENLRKAGLNEIVKVIEGDALKTLPNLEGSYDFVFIDAQKSDYINYFKIIYPKLKKGDVIVGHNAIAQSSAMKDYLNTVESHPELQTVIISTGGGDGMSISYKVK